MTQKDKIEYIGILTFLGICVLFILGGLVGTIITVSFSVYKVLAVALCICTVLVISGMILLMYKEFKYHLNNEDDENNEFGGKTLAG